MIFARSVRSIGNPCPIFKRGVTRFLLYCIVLYCIVLYCIVLYCIVLYYIVLTLRQKLPSYGKLDIKIYECTCNMLVCRGILLKFQQNTRFELYCDALRCIALHCIV